MKTIDKIIESSEAPKDKNVLWVNGDKLLAMVKGKWTPVGGGSSDNVQSGGGESGGGGSVGCNIEYLDVSNETYILDLIGLQSIECKGISDAISIVAPTAAVRLLVEGAGVKITQIKVDWDVTVIKNIGGEIIRTTVLESVLNQVSQDELDNIPRITKEEFYTL